MTVLDVLQSTTEYFKKRALESPRLNAEHLLAHSLGLKRIELYLEFERRLTEEELVPLRELVKRRGQGEPLQHLLGTVEFCGHIFLCDKRALVPRPETEELVELLIADCGARMADWEIIDVGTGSGVIALSLAAKFPSAAVMGSDISKEALGLAMDNAKRLGLGERVRFAQGDLLAALHPDERFDLIVANLPYVAMKDRSSLSREVLCDPEIALFGGESGDDVITRLIGEAPGRLRAGGMLALEVGNGHVEGLTKALRQKNYNDIRSKSDYSGTPRFLLARYG
jgi:release factor glutamine methyltransferase